MKSSLRLGFRVGGLRAFPGSCRFRCFFRSVGRLLVLPENEDLTEDIVGYDDEDRDKDLDDVDVGDIETEDTEPEVILRHIAGIFHDHDGKGEQSEFKGEEREEASDHKGNEFFHDLSL